jgi:hypothetical protein
MNRHARLAPLASSRLGINGTPAGTQIRVAGAVHAGYSTMTDYPLGVVKVIPYKLHLALDALGALALAATPFVTGQYRKGTSQWAPHVALCLFELGSLLLSDPTGRGDYKADVAAVREGNMEDPHRKVHNGQPAVTPRDGVTGIAAGRSHDRPAA